MNAEIDVRPVLRAVRVPTLVLHRTGDRAFPVGGRPVSCRADPRGERSSSWPATTTCPGSATPTAVLGEIEEFLTGARHGTETDRVLATILFTDIVGSTERAASSGRRGAGATSSGPPRAWSATRARPLREGTRSTRPVTASSRRSTARPGPSAARWRSGARVRPWALEVRAGLHTGEVELPATTSVAWPCTSAPGSLHWPAPARCSCRDGEGPRRRVGPGVRGPRHACPQGCPRRVAPVPASFRADELRRGLGANSAFFGESATLDGLDEEVP